jgi:hypothetical protein
MKYQPSAISHQPSVVDMINKPFRPPLLQQVPRPSPEDETKCLDEQPAKRRRVNPSQEDDERDGRTPIGRSRIVATPRKPLLRLANPMAAIEVTKPLGSIAEEYYTVLW